MLETSIFSSVSELWHTRSYALAILIVVTSIMWPSATVIFCMDGALSKRSTTRMTPRGIRCPCRMELCRHVCVAYHYGIFLRNNSTQCGRIDGGCHCFKSKWNKIQFHVRWLLIMTHSCVYYISAGFYGFISATILSLVRTHVISYLHRCLTYKDVDESSAAVQDKKGAQ